MVLGQAHALLRLCAYTAEMEKGAGSHFVFSCCVSSVFSNLGQLLSLSCDYLDTFEEYYPAICRIPFNLGSDKK